MRELQSKAAPAQRAAQRTSVDNRPLGNVARILDLQRTAGNRAVVELIAAQRQPASPVVTGSRSVQRAPRGAIGDILEGAVNWVGDLGRGAKRAGRGLKSLATWDKKAAAKMDDENLSAARLLRKGIRDPAGTFEAMLVVACGGFAAWGSLPEAQRDSARAKFGEGAERIVSQFAAKQAGKALMLYIGKRFVVRIIATAAFKQLASRLGTSAAFGSTGLGLGLTLAGLGGIIEKASEAADRLKRQHPLVYYRLVKEDLHMGWFLAEPFVPEILLEVQEFTRRMIETTTPDGREQVDAGPRRETPINAGPERRVPIASGPAGAASQ